MGLFEQPFNRPKRVNLRVSRETGSGRGQTGSDYANQSPNARFVRWTKEYSLPIEECAKKGLGSLLGLLPKADPFRAGWPKEALVMLRNLTTSPTRRIITIS